MAMQNWMKKLRIRFNKNQRKHQLKTQLVLSFMVVSIAVLALGSFFTYRMILSIMQKRTEEATVQNFIQVNNNIQSTFNEVDTLAKNIISADVTMQFLDIEKLSQLEAVYATRDFVSYIGSLETSYSYIDSIGLFTEDGDILVMDHQREYKIRDIAGEGTFRKEELLRMVEENFSKTSWIGGLSSQRFVNADNQATGEDKPYITAIRGIKVRFYADRTGVLLININEKKLSSIYSSLLKSKKDRIYISNDEGTIVSSVDGNMILQRDLVSSNIDRTRLTGSFTQRYRREMEQVVYYNMQSPRWTMVSHIPYAEYTQDISQMQKIILLISGLSLMIIFIIYRFWINRITSPLKELTIAMKALGKGKLGLTLQSIPKNELGLLMEQFNQMSVNILELMEENRKVEQEKREYELEALQAQINPHFLYNTLNTIKWMGVVIQAKNIVDSITTLVNMLKPIFKSSGSLYRLREELDYTDHYIRIMNYRYGEGIQYVINVPEELLDIAVPRFILQPLIENACFHGLEKRNMIGTIRIVAHMEMGHLLVSVSDNGAGMTVEELQEIDDMLVQDDPKTGEKKSIGLYNVHQRLKIHYGDDYGIKIQSDSDGTRILLKMKVSK